MFGGIQTRVRSVGTTAVGPVVVRRARLRSHLLEIGRSRSSSRLLLSSHGRTTAHLHRFDPPQLSGADADTGLMRADEIHRVQHLNVRDTTDGSSERIRNDLRTAEKDDA